MTRLILPICIISLLSGCQDANPAEREWKEQLYKNLAIVGARNWIVIAESSFPAYTGTGIRTMVSDKTSDEVLLDVLNMLEEEAHDHADIVFTTARSCAALRRTMLPALSATATISIKCFLGASILN